MGVPNHIIKALSAQLFGVSGLFPAGSKGLWLEAASLNTLYQDSAGTTPVTAFAQPVGLELDKSGRVNNVLQATTANRPTYDNSTGFPALLFNGTNSGLLTGAATFSNNMDCFMVMRRNTTAAFMSAYPVIGAPSNFFGLAQASGTTLPANAGSGALTYAVDGVDVPGGTATTRAQLDTALPASAWHVLEVRNLNLSAAAWNAFGFGAYTGFQLNGSIAAIVLCPAQNAATRTTIRRYLGAKVGLVL